MSWSSKEQNSVALSMAEAEYSVVHNCYEWEQLCWIIGIKFNEVPLLCDNESVVMKSWPFISLTLEMLDRKKVIPGYSFWVQLNQVSTKCLEVLKTLATVVCLCLVMLYKQGYCSLNSKFPNHLSSHNLTWDMSFIVKELSAWHRGHVCYISKILMWNLVIYIKPTSSK
jgi:hypothetical protein